MTDGDKAHEEIIDQKERQEKATGVPTVLFSYDVRQGFKPSVGMLHLFCRSIGFKINNSVYAVATSRLPRELLDEINADKGNYAIAVDFHNTRSEQMRALARHAMIELAGELKALIDARLAKFNDECDRASKCEKDLKMVINYTKSQVRGDMKRVAEAALLFDLTGEYNNIFKALRYAISAAETEMREKLEKAKPTLPKDREAAKAAQEEK